MGALRRQVRSVEEKGLAVLDQRPGQIALAQVKHPRLSSISVMSDTSGLLPGPPCRSTQQASQLHHVRKAECSLPFVARHSVAEVAPRFAIPLGLTVPRIHDNQAPAAQSHVRQAK